MNQASTSSSVTTVTFRDGVNFVLVGVYLFAVMLFLFLTRQISPNLRLRERVPKAMSLLIRPFRKMFSAGK